KIPKAPTPDFTSSRLLWMAPTASPNAPPTMGMAEEARSFTVFPEAASTWALRAVWMDSSPEYRVTEAARVHLAAPYRLEVNFPSLAEETLQARDRARNTRSRGSTKPFTSRG